MDAPAPLAAPPAPSFDVVAVVGSAGVDALGTVLRTLPSDFPVPVVVLQHLSEQGRALAAILRRRIRMPVEWVVEGQTLEPGKVLLCPPASGLVVLPDGTATLVPSLGPQDRPGDILLESLVETHGGRILAVMLAGGGRDGAEGARAVKAAGGTVVAQRAALGTAGAAGDGDSQGGGGPTVSAVAVGAVDMVLPLHEIGVLVADVVANGAPPPETSDEAVAMDRVFVSSGEAAAHLRRIDWSTNPLGPVATWPASLAATVRTMLDSPLPVAVHWGPDLVVLPNDAYRDLVGDDAARITARPLRDAWPDDWDRNRAVHNEVLETGRPHVVEDTPVAIGRGQGVREIYVTSALTALRGDQGGVAGTLSTAVDTTAPVLGQRQLDLLRRMQAEATGATGATTVAEACERATAVIAADPGLVPFALVYLFDGPRSRAQLTASTGIISGDPASPRIVVLTDDRPWPLDSVARGAGPIVVDDLAQRLPGLAAGPYPEAPGTAVVLPLRMAHDERAAGVVVLGVSARRFLDPGYRGFLDLVAAQVAAGMTDARTRQQARGRFDALADVDRAKTEFFANVSHEFRTPLTLLLSPLEAALARPNDDIPADVAADLDLVHRNAQRLLRMVGSLLDFSQIEAGRRRGSFEATDLSTLTRDLVGVFRGAADAAGLDLVLDCPPLPEPVWVDRIMWERIVSNLLSNAIKFTLEGQVTVTLRLLPSHAELEVADTGPGIPEADLPHVFERFHRVEGVPTRTAEGMGIGLAVVHDLVRLHHGRARVRNQPGGGSTFTIWVPRGRRTDGQPAAAAVAAPAPKPDSLAVAKAHAEEALGWSDRQLAGALPHEDESATGAMAPGARVLVIDDNADMRSYLRRLLGRHWTVDVARNASEARARVILNPPDLVVADVMLAEVDGLTLVRQLRRDPVVRNIPIVLLSARAGEDATVAGLEAGADDYIVKPFSARELVARVGAHLELSRLRQQRDDAVRSADERLRFALDTAGLEPFEWDAAAMAALAGVIDGDDLATHTTRLNRAITTGEPYVNEYRVRGADGAVRWIRSVAHRLPEDPRRLFGVSTDVTDRRAADDRLREATDRLTADLQVMLRFQELSARLMGATGLERVLDEVLAAAIELQGADDGTVGLRDPETGDLKVVARRGAVAVAAENASGNAPEDEAEDDPDYRVLRPDADAGTLTTPLVDRTGTLIGVITTHTRQPGPGSELGLRLADLYLRQAQAVVAALSGD